jgi:hypothetical protein
MIHTTKGLSSEDQRAQGRRCGCRGTDDYCPCQNVPDDVTLRLRKAAEAAVETGGLPIAVERELKASLEAATAPGPHLVGEIVPPHCSGSAFGTEAVCEDCTTIIDLLGSDDDDKELAEEQLTEWFLNHDCDEASVRKQMARSFNPDLIPLEIWQKCLAEARAEL